MGSGGESVRIGVMVGDAPASAASRGAGNQPHERVDLAKTSLRCVRGRPTTADRRVCPPLPKLTAEILGDPHQLRQVVSTRPPSPSLCVRTPAGHRSKSLSGMFINDDKVSITVRDHGPKDIAKCFQRTDLQRFRKKKTEVRPGVRRAVAPASDWRSSPRSSPPTADNVHASNHPDGGAVCTIETPIPVRRTRRSLVGTPPNATSGPPRGGWAACRIGV